MSLPEQASPRRCVRATGEFASVYFFAPDDTGFGRGSPVKR